MNVAHVPSRARSVHGELTFACVSGRTHLMRQHTPHPFHITRPFRHPCDPQGMVTLYLQSSSGGVYGDDDLALSVGLKPGSAVHLTTQASTVVHDARGRDGASQTVSLDVGAGALLEYVPDPAIMMAGSRLKTRIHANLADGAKVLLADAQLCHDPEDNGRPFDALECEVAITAAGKTLLLDRFELQGADWLTRTGGYRCAGMMLVAGDTRPGAAMLDAAASVPGVYAGLSNLADREVTIVRFLAEDGVALSRALKAIWMAAREAMTGDIPVARRK